jgi:hypothetical protein
METKMVVIKGFPVHLDRMAKVQAALEGISFKALVIKALEKYIDSESWDAKIRKAFTEKEQKRNRKRGGDLNGNPRGMSYLPSTDREGCHV